MVVSVAKRRRHRTTDGEVSVTYRAGTSLSTDTIRATASGGGGDVTGTTDITVQTATVAANTLELLVSSPQLDSDDSEQVTLTALARDVNNNAIPNVNVTFAASSGLIIPVSGTTDANGRATAAWKPLATRPIGRLPSRQLLARSTAKPLLL